MTGECGSVREELAAYLLGGLSKRARRKLEAHIEDCPACRGELERLEAAIEAWRGAEPPPQDESIRQRQIAAAIQEAAGTADKKTPSIWRPLALAGGALAIALLVGLWALPRIDVLPRGALGPVVVEGALVVGSQALLPGGRLESMETVVVPRDGGAKLELEDGSTIRVSGGTRFSMDDPKGARWRLLAGRLACRSRPRPARSPLSIVTPEATASVIGTAFDVSRKVGERRRATTVSVEHGLVKVAIRASGRERLLRDGESITVEGADTQPVAAQAAREPDSATEPPATVRSKDKRLARRLRTPVAEIRRRIRSGRIKDARALLDRARSRAGQRKRELAELAIVEAEVLLAERRYRAAIHSYMVVTKEYPGTPQAEAALFAAAQLAIDHPGSGHDGLRLLRGYLNTHPGGRFHKEAKLLLRAVQEAPR